MTKKSYIIAALVVVVVALGIYVAVNNISPSSDTALSTSQNPAPAPAPAGSPPGIPSVTPGTPSPAPTPAFTGSANGGTQGGTGTPASSSGATASSAVDARDAQRVADLQTVKGELTTYFNLCGYYYPGRASHAGSCPNFYMEATGTANAWALLDYSITGLNSPDPSRTFQTHDVVVPKDPLAGHTYYYGVSDDASHFIVAATLENANSKLFAAYTAPSSTAGYFFGTPLSGGCSAPNYCIVQ